MYLIFDCETDGLPLSKYSKIDDVNNWPKIVSLSWGIYKKNGECLTLKDYIRRPNFEISKESSNIHGISTKKAKLKGIKMSLILEEFLEDVEKAKHLIAHNINFDFPVLICELKRENMNHSLHKMKKICTMLKTTNYCKLVSPFKNEYKWPKLEELYFKLFQTRPKNMHNSKFDVIATAKCFFKLLNLGVLNKN